MRASSAQRISLCPGSYRAEDGLPDTTRPEAEKGTRIHAWLANNESIVLPDDEQEVAIELKCKADKITEGKEVHSEVSLSYGPWEGHPDKIALTDSTIDIPDYKSGWGDVPDPDSNAQLRVYAVLAWKSYGRSLVTCHLCKRGKCPPPVTYDEEDLLEAEHELDEIAKAAMASDAQRIPGPTQCQYCKALGHPDRCPESCRLPATVAELMPSVEAKLAMMPQRDLDTLAQQVQLVAKMGAKVMEELKVRLENNPECSETFKLGKPSFRREITDVPESFSRLPDRVWFAGANLSISEAEKEYAKMAEIPLSEAKRKIAEILQGLIVERPIARKLERR